MEVLVLIMAGIVIMIPAISVVALVRSGKVRQLLEESDAEHRREISVLRAEVDSLHRELVEVTRRGSQPVAPAPVAVVPEKPHVASQVIQPVAPIVSNPPLHKVPEVAPEVGSTPPTASPAPSLPPDIARSTVELPNTTSAPVRLQAIVAPPVSYGRGAVHEPPVPAKSPATAYSGTQTHPVAAYQPPATFLTSGPEPGPRRKTIAERLRSTLPFEELLGMNLFAKIGIVLLVLGFALLGRMALISMGPGARVALIYAASAALLGGGIWLERRERYRLIGRAGIGGGWALLFFTTYAMHHVAAMAVLASTTLDCVLMLLVAISMVAHTLRYKSQVVTGLAFLLAFSTVALSQDSVYALAAGVILALGIVAIALRMNWYELELFGIVASYANHFYWLYKLYPEGFSGHAFPQFWPSSIILLLYWAVFRCSYIVRAIRNPRDETISSLAAIINVVALLGVMKFQSTRPELAFYALLALGAAEFICGQLPACRRRRNAFKLLTVVGTTLMFAAVPFKFSGNSIALFWMIAAELLLVAGILQAEVVFRRLGLIAGTITGMLVIYEARSLVEFRQHSELALVRDGILLLTVSLLFCINAQFLRRKWAEMFASVDGPLAIAQGYLGLATGILGVWAIFPADGTALGWMALFVAAAYGKRRLDDNHLIFQAWALAALVLFRGGEVNVHVDLEYPHHVAARLITLPIIAAAFYGAGWILAGVNDLRVPLRRFSLWAATMIVALLVWLDVSRPWVALVWVAFAVLLAVTGRRVRLPHFCYQEHVLAVAAVAQLVAFNIYASLPGQRYIPLIGCAAAFYAISRFSTLKDASYARVAGWSHTWGATAILAALAWHESALAWLPVLWILFALALAVVDRVFGVEELPYQAHALALLAVVYTASFNLFTNDRWRTIDLRLITVSIVVAVLYALARWVRLPASLRTNEARHAYTWVASVLAGWMMWCELKPVAVAVAWAVFGLLLFELGSWKQQKQLRLQGFGLLIAAFVRIFFVNLTAGAAPGEALSPRVYTIVPMVLIYFYVWTRLRTDTNAKQSSWSAADLVACFGTACVAALLYFEVAPEWVIAAWAGLAFALALSALLLDRSIFLQQAILLVAGVTVRSFAHNLFGASYFSADGWSGRFTVVTMTAALLLAALPVGFRLRVRLKDREISAIDRYLGVRYPEQVFFFAPILMASVMIFLKMNPGMVTLAWGILGVAVILLGLLVSERSYRLTGLFLLVICVGKIVVRDAWLLGERDRYTTFIVLGAALTLVSTLYGKYRETVRKLL